MQPSKLRALLEQVHGGAVEVKAAEAQLLESMRSSAFEDLEFARIDHHRAIRKGFPEVIYGEGKTTEQITEIAIRTIGAGHRLLVTRTDRETFAALQNRVDGLVFHETARLISQTIDEQPTGHGSVLIVSGGTSDLAVAEEAAITAEVMGNRVNRLYDVGVAGLHRLLDSKEQLDEARVIITVAGMEGALPSVVGGLVKAPVIAVPTSVGYGTNFGGVTALLGMLNSCVSGLAVVNIDNGFGAAVMASTINHLG